MARLHLVILNYNTAALLRQCLVHVCASACPYPYTVTVVDNGSTDDSLARLRAAFPDVRTIAATRNRGFAGGNNLALRAILAELPAGEARAHEYVLLLNTDLFLAPETLGVLADFLEATPGAGVVGPRVEKPDGTLDLACRRSFPTPRNAFYKLIGLSRRFPDHPRLAAYNLTHLDPGRLTEVDAVMGACMLVRVAAIDQAGLLDEDFFMYGEDLDWAYRIKRAGWRVYYNPASRVLHYKGATSARRSYRMIVEFYRAMYLFHRKHYAPGTPRALNWAVVAGIVARGVLAFGANVLRPPAGKRVA
ncbi:MAG TPA: glycosyltransferase family 2 protein [Thermomicrobiales bacterium]|nr:glycosyltransferase family 2 protein [Thermomicrobiales bacterium]